MEIEIYHEGFTYCVEAKDNQIVMYKNDIDEWMVLSDLRDPTSE